MTDKQKNLVCSIELSLVKAIINLDEQKMWDLIKQAMKEEKNSEVIEWLNSFDTNSATKCFEAVNLLKQRLEGEE